MTALPFRYNLRKFRKQRGMTQESLAALCGCRQGYISSLERGAFSPSMTILEKLAAALAILPAELLMAEEDRLPPGFQNEGMAVINERSRNRLPAPTIEGKRVVGDSHKVLCLPDIRGRDAFAAYLADNAMAPAFSKGDLVVFSLVRRPADGDVCLVDTGNGKAVFRTALALPGGQWRLQPSNQKFPPTVVKAGRGVRMWPSIGHWRTLVRRPGR